MIDLQEFSWLTAAWDQVSARWKSLSHGILITGNPGIGKGHLALELTRLLLCKEPNEDKACGQCASCQLLENSVHPDFHVLVPENEIDSQPEPIREHANRYFMSEKGASSSRKPSRVIGVDAVRLLSESLVMKSGQTGRKVSLITPADRLNSNSMNALLKLLEEPTADTYIILVTARPYRLAATIRSRCIQLECPTPVPQMVRSWLDRRYPETTIDVLPFARCGIGPLQINAILVGGEQALFQELFKKLCMPTLTGTNPWLLAQECSAIGIQTALRILQYRALAQIRELVTGVESSPGCNNESAFSCRESSIRTFLEIGQFLLGPTGAVDEQLFLEDICTRICQERES
jgi:DNA polymerase-3 subunit delta'